MKKKKKAKKKESRQIGKAAKRVSKDISLLLLKIIINIPGAAAHAFIDPKGVYRRIELEGLLQLLK